MGKMMGLLGLTCILAEVMCGHAGERRIVEFDKQQRLAEPVADGRVSDPTRRENWVVLVKHAEPRFAPRADGAIVIEAEHFAAQRDDELRRWYVLENDGELPELAGAGEPTTWTRSNLSASATASGRTFVKLLPDTRQTHDDKLIRDENFSPQPGKMAILDYPVYFDEPGRYFVWVRAYSTGTEDNGLHVGLDGQWPESGQRMQWCEGKRSWRWECAQRTAEKHCGEPMQIFLDIETAGRHLVHVSMREDGFTFDQLLLTRDRDYRPDGAEASEVVE